MTGFEPRPLMSEAAVLPIDPQPLLIVHSTTTTAVYESFQSMEVVAVLYVRNPFIILAI